MIWALANNDNIEAFPNGKGICELCGKPVFAKCGEIKIWHWSHYKGPDCDNWHEPETEWHYHWKMTFGKDNSEIIIEKENIKHRADVLTKTNVVIELQNSPIKPEVIRKRESFYGERMIWLINGMEFRHNFKINKRSLFIYKFNPNYLRGDNPSERVIKVYRSIPSHEGKYEFTWNYARSSWLDVNKPTFIDFGGPNLFWVKEDMGFSSGNGDLIPKETFIKKYLGDIEYFKNHHKIYFEKEENLIKD
jgi:hypothetical protein